ncbi:Gfo/Idh/MocA family oxidoreductase [Candidatus Woesearchaeota archaeon]|nr:Gfo/Idh/MocA family oxidoreductase [Candidatus Woesearchaeota archaeon]
MTKIGIIGAGKWGINHLRIFSELSSSVSSNYCNLIGLSDIDQNKETLAKQYSTQFFTDYKKMLPLVDAVSVVVPTNYHYEIVKECLNAGKHVLVEKPITLSSEKAKELVELAKKKKLILSVGYLFRFNPAVIELKKRLKEKSGKIQYITSRYVHSSKPPRADSGVVFNLGIHMIDILNFVLEQKPKKVYCKCTNFLDDRNEDSAVIVLNYNDFFATIDVSCCHPLKKRDMWIIAENEKIYVDFFDQIMTVYPLYIKDGEVVKEIPLNIEIRKNEPLKEQLSHFITCVKNSDKNIAEVQNIGEEEYYTTRTCELAMQSDEFGDELELK